MSYMNVKLTGSDVWELETEIKYNIATAKVEDAKLVRFDLCIQNTDDFNRISGSVLRILRSLKKAGAIQHYSDSKGLNKPTPGSQFIINKYSDFVIDDTDESNYPYYVII